LNGDLTLVTKTFEHQVDTHRVVVDALGISGPQRLMNAEGAANGFSDDGFDFW